MQSFKLLALLALLVPVPASAQSSQGRGTCWERRLRP